MMWALVIDGSVREVSDEDPAGKFHPDLEWIEAPSDVEPGWSHDGSDFLAPVSPSASEVAAREEAQRMEAAKAECRRRILMVADFTAQINLAAAAAAGTLSEDDMSAYREGLAWIEAMRARWPEIGADGRLSIDKDDNWPAPSEAIEDLGHRF